MRVMYQLLACGIALGVVTMIGPVAVALEGGEIDVPDWGDESPTGVSCIADVLCWDGSFITCTGDMCSMEQSSCPLTWGKVVCDGATTYCPPCPPPVCSRAGDPCWFSIDCQPSGEPACAHCYCTEGFESEGSKDPTEGPPDFGVCRCSSP
jgi:hypothetical protein